jgi:HAD superfamily hydrolase (TIGR01458 family)
MAPDGPSGLLFDIDGVLVVSWRPIPGAVDAVNAVRAAGHPVAFVTNTTSRSRAEIADSLVEVGFDLTTDDVITAGAATAEHLRTHHPGRRCLVLNDGPSDDLAGIPVTDDAADAEVVVIGSGGPSFTWEAMNQAARAVLDGAPLVAMHGSALWRTADGDCLDAGAYVAALERATGVTSTVIGKPSPHLFHTGCAALGRDPSRVVMVGDDAETDVAAATRAGLVGVLVRTGKYRPGVEERVGIASERVIDSVADLPDWLRG